MAQVLCAHLPQLDDYQKALAFWQTAKRWKSDGWAETVWDSGNSRVEHNSRDANVWRKLRHDSAKRIVTIGHKNDGGPVWCRYRKTDVVTYYPDGAIGVRPWRSRSTSAFIDMITPLGIRAWMTSPLGCLLAFDQGRVDHRTYWWGGGWRFYKMDGMQTIIRKEVSRDERGNEVSVWQPIEGIGTFDEPYVKRDAVRPALQKHHFHDFASWIEMALRLNPELQRKRDGAEMSPQEWESSKLTDRRMDDAEVVEIVDSGSEAWRLLCIPTAFRPALRDAWTGRDAPYTPEAHARKIVERVRIAIYRREGVVCRRDLDYLTSSREVMNLRKQQLKWRG